MKFINTKKASRPRYKINRNKRSLMRYYDSTKILHELALRSFDFVVLRVSREKNRKYVQCGTESNRLDKCLIRLAEHMGDLGAVKVLEDYYQEKNEPKKSN